MREIYGVYEKGMLLADTHIHTNASDDVVKRGIHGLDPHEVVDLAAVTGLSAVAITDHHTTIAAEEARNYAVKQNMPVTVFIGVEVTTKSGAHVVGFDVTHPMQPTNTIEDAIDEIISHNGLVILPHPFYTNWGAKPNGIQEHELLELIEKKRPIHGFEVHSQGIADLAAARPHSRDFNHDAIAFYLQHHEALGTAIASSDTHRLTVGRARTAYYGDLRSAIENKKTVALQLTEGEMYTVFEASLAYLGPERMNRHPSRLARMQRENER